MIHNETLQRRLTLVGIGLIAISAILLVRLISFQFRMDPQIKQTFASQAAIAIENVRLFNDTKQALATVEERTRELTETLDYQTAISEVLRVISLSSTDVTPVFEAIMESARRLLGTATAAVKAQIAAARTALRG